MTAALPAAEVAALAHSVGFDLVGFAKAEPIAPSVLLDWLAQGHHADLDWMAQNVAERLDVTRLFPDAKTVIALACNYWHSDAPSPIARYARGRDYHATLRDKLRGLRRGLREKWPDLRDYGSVDANPLMEKVWAVRAGLGTIGKNACLITPQFGSWVVLAAMVLNTAVDGDRRDHRGDDVCGRCRICVDSCPTGAIVEDRVIDARKCLSYQTIENEGPIPEPLRPQLRDLVFGCDVCQDVCPHNTSPVLAAQRFAPRPVGSLTAQALAGLSKEQWQALAPGTPLARAGYDGVRRNAAYALGATKAHDSRAVLERLCGDQSELVREAAQWALTQLA